MIIPPIKFMKDENNMFEENFTQALQIIIFFEDKIKERVGNICKDFCYSSSYQGETWKTYGKIII